MAHRARTTPGPWPDVAEPHDTYLDNALEKARAIAAALGEPAIADDSGIEVDALDGAPGPRSARFAGEDASDAENLAKLIEVVAASPPEARTARYRCVAAIAWPDGRTLHAEGTCEGTLVTTPRGQGGFGYDPIFVPEGEDAHDGRALGRGEGPDQPPRPGLPNAGRAPVPVGARGGPGPFVAAGQARVAPRVGDGAQVPGPGRR